MTDFRRRRLAMLASGTLAAAAAAQPAAPYPPWHVRTPSAEGQGFAIRNPDAGPACVVVTAAHVVKPGDSVTLTALDRAQSSPRRVQVAARVLRHFADGQLAVLLPAADLAGCEPLRLGDVRAAEQSDRIARTPRVVEASGEAVFSRLLIESTRVDTVQLAVVGTRRVEPSWSGGLVTLDGQALAVVQTVDDRVVATSRLDYSRAFVEKYASWPAPAPARPAWDTSTLPPEYRKAYDAALETKRLAEVAQRVARANALRAEEAELRATAGTAGYGSIDVGDGQYLGQYNGTRVDGFGVLRRTKGDKQGDVLLAQWRTVKAEADGSFRFQPSGPAVWRMESNAANANGHALYEGEQGNRYDGRGVLTFQNGDILWSQWQDGGNTAPMVLQRKSDGYWFTGAAVGGRWQGPGILWDKDGQIVRWGVWRDGLPPEDGAGARR